MLRRFSVYLLSYMEIYKNKNKKLEFSSIQPGETSKKKFE